MPTLAYYLHDLDPYIFQWWFLRPRWYGVAYLLGFLFAYLLIRKLSRDGMLRFNPERVPDLVLNCCIFGVLLGGRLGFVLFYDLPISLHAGRTPLLWDFSSGFPFWGALRVWDGGMSAHGGIVFTILTLMVYSWRQLSPRATAGAVFALIAGAFVAGAAGWTAGYFLFGDASIEVACSITLALGWMTWYGWARSIPVTNIGDASCMVVPVGLFFGRCANFINGELYGHMSRVPWAVKFPSEIWAPTNDVQTITNDQLYPVQQAAAEYLKAHAADLTASQVNFIMAHASHDMYDSVLKAVGGPLEGPEKLPLVRDAIAHYFAAFPDEIIRADLSALWGGPHNGLWQVLHHQFAVILPARHPSQLYEALLEGLLLFIICWTVGRLWRKDGMASGAFLTFYAIMRIIGEQFRVGDTPIDILGMSISKGILYSLPMFLAGAIYWGYWIWRDRRVPWKPPPHGEAPANAPPNAQPSKS